jgi:hypothetical protein
MRDVDCLREYERWVDRRVATVGAYQAWLELRNALEKITNAAGCVIASGDNRLLRRETMGDLQEAYEEADAVLCQEDA